MAARCLQHHAELSPLHLASVHRAASSVHRRDRLARWAPSTYMHADRRGVGSARHRGQRPFRPQCLQNASTTQTERAALGTTQSKAVTRLRRARRWPADGALDKSVEYIESMEDSQATASACVHAVHGRWVVLIVTDGWQAGRGQEAEMRAG